MEQRRRAVRDDERGAAAERTRERILRAAVEEFGAKGYAGARTASIAAAAGVNQQLISYHFGGKQGLLEELRRRWKSDRDGLVPPDASFTESVAAYLNLTLDEPARARLVLWQALGDSGGGDGMAEGERERLGAAVERLRGRQRDGEIDGDLDPGFVLLLAYLLAFAPLALPQHVEAILGVDPMSKDYRARVLEQLAKVISPG